MASIEKSPALLSLPPEILLLISDYLPFYCKHALRLTSRHFYTIIPAVARKLSSLEFRFVQEYYRREGWPCSASFFSTYARYWNVVLCHGCWRIWSSPKRPRVTQCEATEQLQVVEWGTSVSCPECELLHRSPTGKRMNTWK